MACSSFGNNCVWYRSLECDLPTYEKGYYAVIMLYGLFSAVSLQKAVRDRMENIKVTNLYYGLAWLSVCIAIVLLGIGLWNASLVPSEKGFYGMAFILSLFAAVAVQKNVRDVAFLEPELEKTQE